ncbi:type II secretion system protein [Campylobacter jejuni]|nr:type II secretion system protein [Campylobacter jejuni]
MPTFSYRAMTGNGQYKQGSLDADSLRHARQLLREQALIPIELAEIEARLQGKTEWAFWRKPRIGTEELALLTRQLSTLVAAAIPLEEALKAVAQQTENARISQLVSAVRSRVMAGHSLAAGLALSPTAFSDLYCAMVAAGEKSGRLDTVLNRLADYTEQQQKLKNRLFQALVYPLILTLVAFGVITILLVTVVPSVVEQFVHMKQILPLSTRVLMSISDLMHDYGLVLLLLAIGLGAYWRHWLKKKAHRRRYHAALLKLPVIGQVCRGLNSARFARTLSILNASTVPLLDAIEISGEVLTNDEARARIGEAKALVREGGSLHGALQRTRMFPPMMLHMIAAGERSGELDNMLARAADNQDSEFENQVSITLSIFEPALVVGMAVIVLFIVLSILQPILQLNTLMSH